MQVELDANMVAHIQKKAREKAEVILVNRIVEAIDVKQAAAEVKNKAVSLLVDKLSGKAVESIRESEVIQRSIQSAEARINKALAEMLTSGITVKFKDF